MSSNFGSKGVVLQDTGLRKYMISIFSKMFLALGLTGGVSFFCMSSPSFVSFAASGSFHWVLFLSLLGVSCFMVSRAHRLSGDLVSTLFWAHAVLTGAALSPLVFYFSGESIANAFFMTACFYGGMSLYGHSTSRDLTSLGSFLFVGLVCLVLTSIVNGLILHCSALSGGLSAVLIIVFAGLTAYDVQKIKRFYNEGDAADVLSKKVTLGAFCLYLDFINMFIHILHLLGRGRR
jgi:FtsH-binding integral membrane protein